MFVSIFSTTFVWNCFTLRRTEQDMIKHVYWSSCKVPVILVRFQWRLHYLDGFRKKKMFSLLWRCGPTRAMASSFLRFLDHTQRCITVGRTPLDEWSARRRDLTTNNTHNRQTSMPAVGFEPTISQVERHFGKMFRYKILWKSVQWSRVVPCGRTDRRTDITKLIFALRNFTKALKKS